MSASAGCGRARWSRWWSRMGGRRPELPERRAPSAGGNGERPRGRCCARVKERARERVQERVWQAGRRQARLGAPGGRLGCVHPGACAPCGGRTLPACHGVAARPSTRVDATLARAGVTRGRAGPASASGPKARPRPASAPLSLLSIFFEFLLLNIFFQAQFDPFKILFRFCP